MNNVFIALISMSIFSFFSSAKAQTPYTDFYSLTAEDIHGSDFQFAQLKGKKTLIVNTASKCGFTPQYNELQELYRKYKDRNFTIIAFPSNDFLFQEPGNNETIEQFCRDQYEITFPIMSKVKVSGSNKHSVYQFLTMKSNNGKLNSKVKWNFQKYLVDEQGQFID